MKILVLILLFIFPIIVSGQNPFIKSNTTNNDSIKSDILHNFLNEYDFIISYRMQGSWEGTQIKYSMLARKNNKWYILDYRRYYRLNSFGCRDTSKLIQSKLTKKNIVTFKVKDLFEILESQHFWDFNTDSLNIASRIIIEPETDMPSAKSITYSEETIYKFEILTSNAYRIVWAKDPELYLAEFPEITIRNNFIICKNAFQKIVK